MILYDKFYNILGINDIALGILGFDSFEVFMRECKSLDAMVYRHTKENDATSIFESIIKSNKRQRVITLKRKDGRTISVLAQICDVYMLSNEEIYELRLLITDENKTQEEIKQAQNSLRLPNLLAQDTKALAPSAAFEKFDEAWLKKEMFLLDLSSEELLSYLSDFIQNAQKSEIRLQNAMLSNDKVTINKIAKKLEKVALNFHLTPLAKTYESIQNAGQYQYQELIKLSRYYLSNLSALINKEN
ncbi:hypothetical protein [Campylobacter sp. 19-13652]|uniref:hypothetical protein n=1 Tax=Campylobacter sp. 19-13652 TaxID=2840180 RepID=UPI001C741260|nr:hypothetical protein [Campylobacter sp. 19-13652]BCX79212.1 hypothetical protein LBC_06740 [Campylobacter sp. 19-13652]